MKLSRSSTLFTLTGASVACLVSLTSLASLASGCSGLIGIPDVVAEPSDASVDSAPTSDAMADADARAASDARDDGPVVPPVAGDGGIDATSDGGTGPDAAPDGGNDADAPRDGGSDAPTCVDTMTDPRNCGACGHDCLLGTCAAGVCQPYTIVKSMLATAARDLAIVGPSIYWTEVDDVAVRKASKVDGTTLTTLARGEAQNVTFVDSITATTTGGGGVLWGNSQSATGAIVRCGLAGCNAMGQKILEGLDAPKRIFAEGDSVFWVEPRKVMSAKSADGSGVLAISSGFGTPSAATADAVNVYWADTDGSVYRAPRAGLPAGTPPALVAKGESGALTFIRVDATTVYWAMFKDSGFVYSAPKLATGATPFILASAQPRPNYIAVDATHVYWSNIGIAATSANTSFLEGSVHRCRLPTCAGGPEAIALRQKRLWAIALDDEAIYWSAAGNRDNASPGNLDGAIWKRAK